MDTRRDWKKLTESRELTEPQEPAEQQKLKKLKEPTDPKESIEQQKLACLKELDILLKKRQQMYKQKPGNGSAAISDWSSRDSYHHDGNTAGQNDDRVHGSSESSWSERSSRFCRSSRFDPVLQTGKGRLIRFGFPVVSRFLSVFLVPGLMMSLSACSSGEKVEDTMYEPVILQYGMPANLKAENVFVDEVLGSISDFKAVFTSLPEDQSVYPPFGTYQADLSWKQNGKTYERTIDVEVRDTIAPVIYAGKEIQIPVDVQSFDYEKELQISDNDVYKVEVDDSAVKYGEPGTYMIQVDAVDDSQNRSEQVITVQVSELDQNTLAWQQEAEKAEQAINQEENQGVVAENTANSDSSGEVDTSVIPNTARGIPIVNKKHGLPQSYAPGEDPTAAAALQQMITAMQAAGLDISNGYSGYRSYEYQQQLYDSYAAASGQEEADTFSARPGFSEHQTGLAFDLKHGDGSLVTRSEEADWIRDHAHEYGFIVRYKEGWQDITGYVAEPWHVRYIGAEAADITESGLSLEEYLGVEGGGYNE